MGTSAIVPGGGGVPYLPSYNANTSSTQHNNSGSTPVAAVASPAAPSKVVAATNTTKAAAPTKPQATASTPTSKSATRAMSHMVESYNPQGKVRIKYEDSNNNVIYQIPPEMVARTQDLMTNSQTANIKA